MTDMYLCKLCVIVHQSSNCTTSFLISAYGVACGQIDSIMRYMVFQACERTRHPPHHVRTPTQALTSHASVTVNLCQLSGWRIFNRASFFFKRVVQHHLRPIANKAIIS